MPNDFSSPFVAGAIVTANGQRFPFWSNAGEVGRVSAESAAAAATISAQAAASRITGDAVIEAQVSVDQTFLDPGLESMAWIQEVTVETQLADIPKITISLSPPFEEGRRFLNSELIEYGITTIEVQLGYSTGPDTSILSPVYTGVMQNPDVSIGEEVTITINAVGVAAWTLTRGSGGRVAKEGESRGELVERIIEGPKGPPPHVGRKLRFNDDAVVGRPPAVITSATAHAAWDEEVDYNQGGKSDWTAIWELANAANVRFYTVGDQIIFVPRVADFSRPPRRTFYLYDYPGGILGADADSQGGAVTEDAEAGVFPIINFTSPTNAVYLPASVRGYVMTGDVNDINPRAKVLPKLVNHADTADQNAATSDSIAEPPPTPGLPSVEPGTLDGPQRVSGDSTIPEEVKEWRSEFMRDSVMGVQVEIETVGIPTLFPGETVLLRGLGKRFERDRWGVLTVRHSIGLGGFATTFTAVSNVDALMERGLKTVATVNEKPKEDFLSHVLVDLGIDVKGS